MIFKSSNQIIQYPEAELPTIKSKLPGSCGPSAVAGC